MCMYVQRDVRVRLKVSVEKTSKTKSQPRTIETAKSNQERQLPLKQQIENKD